MFLASQLDVFLDSTIQVAGQQEVEVDKEALVKILARYPGTFDGTWFAESWLDLR